MVGLLTGDGRDCGCVHQTGDYSMELETMYSLLDEMTRQITAYKVLYSVVKVQFLGRKLKELRKEIPTEKPAFLMAQTSIRLTYGS